jgi:hypothetical protein
MNTAKKSIARAILDSWLRVMGGVSATREHSAWLLANLRQLRDDERALNDAMHGRILTLESRLPTSSQEWLREWDAIEHSSRPAQAKALAMRALYLSLADRYASVVAVSGKSHSH